MYRSKLLLLFLCAAVGLVMSTPLIVSPVPSLISILPPVADLDLNQTYPFNNSLPSSRSLPISSDHNPNLPGRPLTLHVITTVPRRMTDRDVASHLLESSIKYYAAEASASRTPETMTSIASAKRAPVQLEFRPINLVEWERKPTLWEASSALGLVEQEWRRRGSVWIRWEVSSESHTVAWGFLKEGKQ